MTVMAIDKIMHILVKPALPLKFSVTQVQFIKYLLVGGIAFIADFGCLYLLKEYAKINYLIAATLGFCVGLAINYSLSILYVFEQRTISNKYIEFLIFGTIGIIGVFLNVAIIFLLTEYLHVFYLHSKIAATIFVFLFNFGVRKICLFSSG